MTSGWWSSTWNPRRRARSLPASTLSSTTAASTSRKFQWVTVSSCISSSFAYFCLVLVNLKGSYLCPVFPGGVSCYCPWAVQFYRHACTRTRRCTYTRTCTQISHPLQPTQEACVTLGVKNRTRCIWETIGIWDGNSSLIIITHDTLMILQWLIHYAMVCCNASQSQTLTSFMPLPHLIKQMLPAFFERSDTQPGTYLHKRDDGKHSCAVIRGRKSCGFPDDLVSFTLQMPSAICPIAVRCLS